MDIVIGLVLSVLGSALVVYGYDKSPRMARWLIRKSASRLQDGERWQQEWLADLEYRDGKFDELVHAVGCTWAGLRMRPPTDIQDMVSTIITYPVLYRMRNARADVLKLQQLVGVACQSRANSDCEQAAVLAERLGRHITVTRAITGCYQVFLKNDLIAKQLVTLDECSTSLRGTAKTLRDFSKRNIEGK